MIDSSNQSVVHAYHFAKDGSHWKATRATLAQTLPNLGDLEGTIAAGFSDMALTPPRAASISLQRSMPPNTKRTGRVPRPARWRGANADREGPRHSTALRRSPSGQTLETSPAAAGFRYIGSPQRKGVVAREKAGQGDEFPCRPSLALLRGREIDYSNSASMTSSFLPPAAAPGAAPCAPGAAASPPCAPAAW